MRYFVLTLLVILLTFMSSNDLNEEQKEAKYFTSDERIMHSIELQIQEVVPSNDIAIGTSVRGQGLFDVDAITCSLENPKHRFATDSIYRVMANKIATILKNGTPVEEYYDGMDVVFKYEEVMDSITKRNQVYTFKLNTRD